MSKKIFRLAVVAFLAIAIRPDASAFAQSLPAGWATADIGAVGAQGSASGDLGTLVVRGAGADVWGSADAFRYAYTLLAGDVSIVSQVAAEDYIADWTKAGVMIRESLAPGSRQASMFVSAAKGLAFQRRLTTNGVSTSTSGGVGKAPYFVRMTRAGNLFTASRSLDGITWTTVGTDTIAMGTAVYVGVAVSSHVAGVPAGATFTSTAVTAASGTSTETIVFMRHGEKPAGGYGQLTCQGLQRALALPPVLAGAYGPPQYVFAPSPAVQVPDAAGSFYYVRPLATIEPTAIRFGLPVNTRFGYSDITGLQAELLSPAYASSTVLVAWEHLQLQKIVQNILTALGSDAIAPPWSSTDFDSLYVVRVTNASGVISVQFAHDFEGLNSLSSACP